MMFFRNRATALAVIMLFVRLSEPLAAANELDELRVRVGAYNISFLSEATPTQIGLMLQQYAFDIVGLTEVPQPPAGSQLATAIGSTDFYVGNISSGQSADKRKGIFSQTPLTAKNELDLSTISGGFVGGGESATHSTTLIDGISISVYCLHISDGTLVPMQKLLGNSAFTSDNADVVMVIGDFNAKLTDPQIALLMAQGFRPSWQDLNMDVSAMKTYDLIPGRGPNGTTRDEGVIDHIFYKSSPGFEINAISGGIVPAVTVLGAPMSDHAMVWAELSIISVPEPSTVVLLITGISAAIVAMLRRRNQPIRGAIKCV